MTSPLTVKYNEVWAHEDTDDLSPSELDKYKGMNDIFKLYWDNDKVVAMTVEQYYEKDKTHKIVQVFDRCAILNEIEKIKSNVKPSHSR